MTAPQSAIERVEAALKVARGNLSGYDVTGLPEHWFCHPDTVRDLCNGIDTLTAERDQCLAEPDDSRRHVTVIAFRDLRDGLTARAERAEAESQRLREALRELLDPQINYGGPYNDPGRLIDARARAHALLATGPRRRRSEKPPAP